MSAAVMSEIPKKLTSPWPGFRPGRWQQEINLRDFIQQNYEPYEGDGSFLGPPPARAGKIRDHWNTQFVEELRKGILDISQAPSSSPRTVPPTSIATTKSS